MKELILGKVRDAGLAFAAYARKEDEELDEDTLCDALMTGHITPDEFAEIDEVQLRAPRHAKRDRQG